MLLIYPFFYTDFTSLVQLSLASTNIKLQNQKMEKKKGAFLEILDVSNTLIEDTDLTNVICQLKSLLDLKLNGCENITTKSLSFLPRELKHLRSIRFPNREHEIDGVLARYKGNITMSL
jgi:hypothetical protein